MATVYLIDEDVGASIDVIMSLSNNIPGHAIFIAQDRPDRTHIYYFVPLEQARANPSAIKTLDIGNRQMSYYQYEASADKVIDEIGVANVVKLNV
jgi:hypothetical protein